jgi:regulator of nucleoside diphosphate kinase
MPTSSSRTLTDFDFRRLDALFERFRAHLKPPPTLSILERELRHAAIVKPTEVPASVVTMNSKVEVFFPDTDERRALTLAFPSLAEIDVGRVSVLAPLGTALIGCREGEEVSWQTRTGPRWLQVERVIYQPEAAGRFDL